MEEEFLISLFLQFLPIQVFSGHSVTSVLALIDQLKLTDHLRLM